jgi:hypothetical protein
MGSGTGEWKMDLDGEEVTVKCLSYVQISVDDGTKWGNFKSAGLPLTMQEIPATGERVFRMDLTEAKETLAAMRAETEAKKAKAGG